MPKPMCGPAGSVETKRRPMCGPKPGSPVWKQMITRDVRKANLAKARQIKEAKKDNNKNEE